MIKYPISQSSFREIRKSGCVYADKTGYIHQMAGMGKYYFLSRPRRFGKSLLLSTMDCYFRGERELFAGLDIDRLEPGEWTPHPVLRLDFTRRGYNQASDLPRALSDFVTEWENEYGISHSDDTPDGRFNRLIGKIYETAGIPVVVLIDEYDSPVVDVCENPELEAVNRKTLHDFYRVLKANEDKLKFVFLTGVGKLGQINIFSGLNNIKDLSLDPKYTAICGITTEELLGPFREGIEEMAEDMGLTFEETLLQLKKHYDGYHFSRNLIDVYNPFSLINSLYDKAIRDYWFQSGTPTRLISQFLDNDWGATDLEGAMVSGSTLDSGDVLGNNLALTCYYTGYLTIKSYNIRRDAYTLGYPNGEVRTGFFKDLMEVVKNWGPVQADNFVFALHDLIDADDIDGFLHELQSFLAGIPYLSHTDKESQWQKDIMIISRLVGLNVDAEQRTSRGRIDMVLEGGKAIYILEFKYNGTPEQALAQINEKEYALPYTNTLNPKPVVKVGVNISPKTRNIDSWVVQR